MDQHLSQHELRLPLTGYSYSGVRRENGIDAIKEYLQVKSVWLATPRRRRGSSVDCLTTAQSWGGCSECG